MRAYRSCFVCCYVNMNSTCFSASSWDRSIGRALIPPSQRPSCSSTGYYYYYYYITCSLLRSKILRLPVYLIANCARSEMKWYSRVLTFSHVNWQRHFRLHEIPSRLSRETRRGIFIREVYSLKFRNWRFESCERGTRFRPTRRKKWRTHSERVAEVSIFDEGTHFASFDRRNILGGTYSFDRFRAKRRTRELFGKHEMSVWDFARGTGRSAYFLIAFSRLSIDVISRKKGTRSFRLRISETATPRAMERR